MEQLLDVVSVEALPGHVLLLEFENRERRSFCMVPYLEKKPYNRLKDSPLFFKATVAYGTVVWPGNIDISPETLYCLSIPVQQLEMSPVTS